MTQSIDQLVRWAGELANAGHWQDAERTWQQVLALDPRHPKALFSLGVHARQRGEIEVALNLLQAARAVAPGDLLTLLTLAAVHQQRGETEAERDAIDASLAVDAYFLPGLLARANWFERHGTAADAAVTYRNVLKIAPPESTWPPAMRPQMDHARRVVASYTQRLEAHVVRETARLQAELPPELGARWREAAALIAGRTRPFVQDCNQLHVPRLPPITFYERKLFAWIAKLERQTDAIRAELLRMLEAERDRFQPYIAYRPGDPVNQWQELNHSLRWSSFHLWRGGMPVEENLARCPVTAAALAALPRAEIEGLCPNAMFSALAPHTSIPPHHGETNARLVAHLPLIVPPRCTMRVGFDTREWVEGEVFVFDDTIEHAAQNDSDQLRVVLIFDLWNPLLTNAEQRMVQAMTRSVREFNG